jgi:hypothetical protein
MSPAAARSAVLRRVPALALALAVALLGAVPARGGETDDGAVLGRIFMTPAERRALDQRRERGSADETALPRDLLPARARVERRVVMNGLVRPSHAEPVIWINGKPTRLPGGPDAQDRVTVRSGGAGPAVRLKPGQSWDPLTRRVRDCAQCAAPPPAPPEPAVAPAEPQAAAPPEGATPAVASVSSVPAPAVDAGRAAP